MEQHGDSIGISGKLGALVVGDAYNADDFTSPVDIELVLVDDTDDEEKDDYILPWDTLEGTQQCLW